MAQREWAEKDYYADLGVSSSASQADIKRAYRKLARDNHPDTHPGDTQAETRFKKVAEAYDVIGDEQKRKEYDEMKAMLSSGMGGFGRSFGQRGGAGFPGGFRSTSSEDFDISDLFGQASGGSSGGFSAEGGLGDIFGGIFNRGGGARHATRPTRGSDVETQITLDFREATKGTTIPIRLTGDAPCNKCHGSGSASAKPATCGQCNGTGFESESKGTFGFSKPCSNCDGTGTKITDPCKACGGTGTVNRTRSITVKVPAGVIDGQRVRLAGQGEAGPNGLPSGDLFVTVHVRPDPVFTRSGDDLELTVPISFAEAVLDSTVTVPTLDGPVTVRLRENTPNGRTLRVRGRGVPKRDGTKGDLLVTVEVVVPDHLDAGATSALRSYAQAEKDSGFDPRKGWAGND
ncbi:Chaperone protein DnaJ [Corynebacterium ciconiae DSM 44920]|uniref:molecular chaperone DnaJ n=1 Tax=Corynebacterium ciconiae TaxID=227319 RepID=UPI0003772DE0|nr:molecular chaperone DnaJ [Corynebacterium ciconiae]WKD62063.1 Chaperone protein DnaJ [Corynebacterium ciconiae DSM 44920]